MQSDTIVQPLSDNCEYSTQGLARTNHSKDPQPYLANIIAGFDPRPWEEHAPSFAMPSASEWETVLTQIKAQCLDPRNHFGFPDNSQPNGFQPAFNICKCDATDSDASLQHAHLLPFKMLGTSLAKVGSWHRPKEKAT